jgi:hypothetical protein
LIRSQLRESIAAYGRLVSSKHERSRRSGCVWPLTFSLNWLRPVGQLAPDWLAPDWLAPDWLAPDWLAPDWLAPDWLAPDWLAPE